MRVFGIHTDKLEVTRNGMFGGPPSTGKEFVPGISHYLIDGRHVSQEEFVQALIEDFPERADEIRAQAALRANDSTCSR